MFVAVDKPEVNGPIEGFTFTNQRGITETIFVEPNEDTVKLADRFNEYHIFIDDIPNMIKALQATYNHCKGIQQ